MRWCAVLSVCPVNGCGLVNTGTPEVLPVSPSQPPARNCRLTLLVGSVLIQVTKTSPNGLAGGFAALVFARSLRATAHVPEALGSNLLGAVVGGCLEYLSLYLGLGALPLLALGLYGISWACRRAA